ncbi:hypothetical protein [Dryocola clanedunensis]|nr:hypothetical protein [Cedecea sulfonylureivorans]
MSDRPDFIDPLPDGEPFPDVPGEDPIPDDPDFDPDRITEPVDPLKPL